MCVSFYSFVGLFTLSVCIFTLFVCLFMYLSLEKALETRLKEIGFLKWFFLYRIFFDLCNGYCTMFPWIEQFQLKNKDVKFNNTSYFWKYIGKIWLFLGDPTDLWYNRHLEVDYHFNSISFNFWIKNCRLENKTTRMRQKNN